jgi:hypothetical protein
LNRYNLSKSTKTALFFLSLLPLQWGLMWWFNFHPDDLELYYIPFFEAISTLQLYSLAWLPFSIGDVFYLFLIIWLAVLIYRFIKFKRNRLNRFISFLGFCALFYTLFNVFWGFNYYRRPLNQQLQLSSNYSSEALVEFTCELIEVANASHLSIAENDTSAVNFNFSKSEMQNLVFEAYQEPSNFPNKLNYPTENIKSSLWSLPLSYAGFSGYLNPFTKEAQFNSLMPQYKWPTTMAHEVSHQLGFAKENEANFISALVCINSKHKYLRYAGLTFALKYSLNDIYKRDPELFKAMLTDVNEGIIKNYKTSQQFWEKYRGPSEVIMKQIYGNFLKANNQPKGIETYSYVTALLVNYHNTYQLF